jgi:hypothetical protein
MIEIRGHIAYDIGTNVGISHSDEFRSYRNVPRCSTFPSNFRSPKFLSIHELTAIWKY